MMWWDSLTFVEKRMSKHKDYLVITTENAIMNEVTQFYQKSPEESQESGGENGENEA